MSKKNLLISIAVLGMLITGYLSYSYFTNAVPFCSVDAISSCASVVKSHYAKIGFVPVAFAGFVAWASLLVAFLFLNKTIAKNIALGISGVGVVAGGYFNGIMFWKLNAFCPWCESSHFLMIATFLILAHGFFMTKKLAKGVSAAVILFVVPFWLVSSGSTSQENYPLADCLSEKNVVMYGAYWCPHCKEQKELFGSSFERIKYVECAEKDNPRQQTAECKTAGVKQYPTWIKNDGERVTGTQSLESLKALGNC